MMHDVLCYWVVHDLVSVVQQHDLVYIVQQHQHTRADIRDGYLSMHLVSSGAAEEIQRWFVLHKPTDNWNEWRLTHASHHCNCVKPLSADLNVKLISRRHSKVILLHIIFWHTPHWEKCHFSRCVCWNCAFLIFVIILYKPWSLTWCQEPFL